MKDQAEPDLVASVIGERHLMVGRTTIECWKNSRPWHRIR
jgi:hypothetical protein